ncbi:lysozyme inhibitor LprI family protein [Caulobacter sp. CCG-8]|uniref:lysozyme inhibitor LprI family protein n=1 Tax=Caulobacter sp. CCG-8 TaxID=3127958 RepID=UPI00307E4808
MIRSVALAAVLLLATAPTTILAAKPVGAVTPVERCTADGGGDASRIAACIRALAAQEEARLVRAYDATMTSMNDMQRLDLEQMQTAWVAFRDADCASYIGQAGMETQGPVRAATCAYARTRQRADELDHDRRPRTEVFTPVGAEGDGEARVRKAAKCVDRIDGDDVSGARECLSNLADKEDDRLNAVYKAALGRLDTPVRKQALRKAQRAWIDWRDLDCVDYLEPSDAANYDNRTYVRMNACYYYRTGERADELDRYPAHKPAPVTAVQEAARCDGDTYEVLECISELLDAQDARLNRAYQAALAQPEPGRTALRNAQRAWIKTRDAQCNAVLDVGPDVRVGLQGNLEVTRCLLKQTEARAAVLERQAKP